MQGRKYEVVLEDGTTVSRQRAHQLKYPEKYKATAKKSYEKHKARRMKRQKDWLIAFEEENGIPYHKYYRLKIKENHEATSKE